MATKIRLARGGSKKRPYYRVVVANSRAPRDGDFIEKVGTYDPLLAKGHEDRVTLKSDRITYWLAQGARPSERVALFIERAGIALPEYLQKELSKKKLSRKEKAPKKEQPVVEETAPVAATPAPEVKVEAPVEVAPAVVEEVAPVEVAPEAPAAEEVKAEEAPVADEAPAAEETENKAE